MTAIVLVLQHPDIARCDLSGLPSADLVSASVARIKVDAGFSLSEQAAAALAAQHGRALVVGTTGLDAAAQAIARLVDTFPAQEKDPVRNQLAGSLRAVLAQRLLPDLQGGRVALYELLVNTAAAANLIREGKTWQLPGIIQTGQQAGMQNFDQSLAERRAQGRL